MNDKTRTEIGKIISEIHALVTKIVDVHDEEQGKYDNMPEGLQQGENGEKMNQAIEDLSSAESSLEEAISYLDAATTD